MFVTPFMINEKVQGILHWSLFIRDIYVQRWYIKSVSGRVHKVRIALILWDYGVTACNRYLYQYMILWRLCGYKCVKPMNYYYGVSSMSKMIINATFVYLSLINIIIKYDLDIAEVLPDLYILGQIYKCWFYLYIRARYINMGQIYISEQDLYVCVWFIYLYK